MRTRLAATAVLAALVVTSCSDQSPAVEPPAAAGSPRATSTDAVDEDLELPDGTLRPLVPAPSEVPTGLVPLLQASGPRDAAAVAEFSADASAAAAALSEHGFTDAYVVQYASPTDSRALTVVAVRFATAQGARADLEADLAEGTGDVVDAGPPVGDASEVRRVELPDGATDELVTVRFRAGETTWLLAWRAPRPADARVPVDLARRLAGRA